MPPSEDPTILKQVNEHNCPGTSNKGESAQGVWQFPKGVGQREQDLWQRKQQRAQELWKREQTMEDEGEPIRLKVEEIDKKIGTGKKYIINYEGHTYNKANTNRINTIIYWRCSKRGCKARIHTNADENPLLLKELDEHCHELNKPVQQAEEENEYNSIFDGAFTKDD